MAKEEKLSKVVKQSKSNKSDIPAMHKEYPVKKKDKLKAKKERLGHTQPIQVQPQLLKASILTSTSNITNGSNFCKRASVFQKCFCYWSRC